MFCGDAANAHIGALVVISPHPLGSVVLDVLDAVDPIVR